MIALYLVAIALGVVMTVEGRAIGIAQIIIVAIFFGLRLNHMIKNR